MAAVFQLSVLGTRPAAIAIMAAPAAMIRPEELPPGESLPLSPAGGSGPRACFSAGRLSRRAGMAVVRLAAWLRVMGIRGVRAR